MFKKREVESAVNVASVQRLNRRARKSWGKRSYARIIQEAIRGSPQKRLMLRDIYRYIMNFHERFGLTSDIINNIKWKVWAYLRPPTYIPDSANHKGYLGCL